MATLGPSLRPQASFSTPPPATGLNCTSEEVRLGGLPESGQGNLFCRPTHKRGGSTVHLFIGGCGIAGLVGFITWPAETRGAPLWGGCAYRTYYLLFTVDEPVTRQTRLLWRWSSRHVYPPIYASSIKCRNFHHHHHLKSHPQPSPRSPPKQSGPLLIRALQSQPCSLFCGSWA